MRNEFKKKSEEALAADGRRPLPHTKRRDLEAERGEQAIATFLQIRQSAIIPAFERFGKRIADAGWKTRIEIEDGTGEDGPEEDDTVGRIYRAGCDSTARIVFIHDSYNRPGVYRAIDYPSLTILCDKITQSVKLRGSTITPDHGGSSRAIRTIPLQNLDEAVVLEELADHFEKLLRSIAYYGAVRRNAPAGE